VTRKITASQCLGCDSNHRVHFRRALQHPSLHHLHHRLGVLRCRAR